MTFAPIAIALLLLVFQLHALSQPPKPPKPPSKRLGEALGDYLSEGIKVTLKREE